MTTLGTASDGKTGGSVRVSGQRLDGARGARLAPEPKSAAAGLTLTDPVNYTRPWHSNTKVWGLIPKEALTLAGWSGIAEDRCVPSENAYYTSFEPLAPGQKTKVK